MSSPLHKGKSASLTDLISSCDILSYYLAVPKWSGFGGAGLLPTGDDRFSTALEPWGNWGEFPAPGNWNFYSYWIDGKLRGHWKGLNWRKTESLKANALTLETFITDRWTKKETNIVDFDNLVIAKEYIGPAGSDPAGK